MRIDTSNLNSILLSGKKLSADFSLMEGEIIKAIVSEMDTNGAVKLTLNDGRTIAQARAVGVDLSLGESIVLQVCKADENVNLQLIAREDTFDANVKSADSEVTVKTNTTQSDGVKVKADSSDNEAIGKLAELVVKGTQAGKALKIALSTVQEFRSTETKVQNINTSDSKLDADKTVNTKTDGVTLSESEQQTQNSDNSKVIQTRPKLSTSVGEFSRDINIKSNNVKQKAEVEVKNVDVVKSNSIDKDLNLAKPKTTQTDSNVENSAAIEENGNTKNVKPTEINQFNKQDIINNIKQSFVEISPKVTVDAKTLKQHIDTLGERLSVVETELISMGDQARLAQVEVSNVIKTTNLNDSIQQFTYLQLPVIMNQTEQTAELYVFHRNENKSKANNDAGLTIMLSLSTQNIGRVETLVKAKGKNIQVELRGETKEVIDIIEQNVAMLYREIENEGYNLTRLGCRLIKQPISPNTAVEVLENAFVDGMRRLDVVI